MKRTPMPPRRTPLRRTRIKPISDRRRAERDQRRAAVAQAHARDGWRCVAAPLVPELACWGPLDGHEPLTRARGGDPLDPDQIITVCRGHHDWIDSEQVRAHELGLLRHSWDGAR